MMNVPFVIMILEINYWSMKSKCHVMQVGVEVKDYEAEHYCANADGNKL